MRVVRIGAEARGAFRDQVVFRRCGQVSFCGEDFGASFAGLVGDGGDDPGVVAGCVKEAVEFADIGGAESVIVVYDDVESDGGEGEEREEGGQGVSSWETHFCSWKIEESSIDTILKKRKRKMGKTIEQLGGAPSYVLCLWAGKRKETFTVSSSTFRPCLTSVP